MNRDCHPSGRYREAESEKEVPGVLVRRLSSTLRVEKRHQDRCPGRMAGIEDMKSFSHKNWDVQGKRDILEIVHRGPKSIRTDCRIAAFLALVGGTADPEIRIRITKSFI